MYKDQYFYEENNGNENRKKLKRKILILINLNEVKTYNLVSKFCMKGTIVLTIRASF